MVTGSIPGGGRSWCMVLLKRKEKKKSKIQNYQKILKKEEEEELKWSLGNHQLQPLSLPDKTIENQSLTSCAKTANSK